LPLIRALHCVFVDDRISESGARFSSPKFWTGGAAVACGAAVAAVAGGSGAPAERLRAPIEATAAPVWRLVWTPTAGRRRLLRKLRAGVAVGFGGALGLKYHQTYMMYVYVFIGIMSLSLINVAPWPAFLSATTILLAKQLAHTA
jgi:hypothetical protein